MVLKVYWEIPLNKNAHHIATSQLICIDIQLTGFYMIQVLTKHFLRKDFKTVVAL